MSALGPADSARLRSAADLLPFAAAAGSRAGVTRLAELTRLDRLGLPVWQAVRPASRALSVHQGKGPTDEDARIGALLEAVESHAAETFDEEGPDCRFDELPAEARAPDLADFAVYRGQPPSADAPYRWGQGRDLLTGRPFYLPFATISLDLTREVPSPFERVSNGVAAGSSVEEATCVALQEVIERDAVTEWHAGGLFHRMRATIDPGTVPYDWFRLWRDRLAQACIAARFYRAPSITGTPVVLCELNDLAKTGLAYRSVNGRGCHPDPEQALFKALAEALQGRATYIAGSREDLPPSSYAARAGAGVRAGIGLPLPPGMRGVDWREIEPVPAGLSTILEAVDRAGYSRVALVELARPKGLAVVRVFVCGLASIHRRRRAPI